MLLREYLIYYLGSNGSSTISIIIMLSQFHNQTIHAILNSSTIQHIH
ncbi:hypothetical protein F383_28871 [Gossypium arboreum]|uniref:Uncharacterized protein n=1 Tax=Gossypium arboreum TaxID=29729 RepID=A0A0B0PK14_GOSAR|nr:hypothetical protein F383_28871 [Gossypium arboreum]